MKQCSRCRREYADDLKFCPMCGIPLVLLADDGGPAEPAPEDAVLPEAPEEASAVSEETDAPASDGPDAQEEVAAAPEDEPAGLPPAPDEIPPSAGAAPDIPVDEAEEPDSARSPAREGPAGWTPEPILSQDAPPYAPPPDPKSEKKKRAKRKKAAPDEAPAPGAPEKKRGEEPLNFGRRLLGVLLCAVLFLLLLAATLVYDVRDYSAEPKVLELLTSVDASSVMASDLIPGAPRRQRLSQWLVDALDEAVGDVIVITSKEMETFFDESTLKDFLAERGAAFLKDIYSGGTSEDIDRGDVTDLLKDSSEFMEEKFGLALDRNARNAVAGALEDSGILDGLSTETIRQEAPGLYYGLFLGCSWVALGVFVLLAILFIWLLAKSLKGFRRALEGTGIVLIVLGVLRTVLALLARLLPKAWQAILAGNYLLSTVTGKILFAHILIPSVAVLGVGVVLTAITALIGRVRRKKLAAMEATEPA